MPAVAGRKKSGKLALRVPGGSAWPRGMPEMAPGADFAAARDIGPGDPGDPLGGGLLSARDVARLFATPSREVSKDRVRRWATAGCLRPSDGARVMLRRVAVPGGFAYTRRDVLRFMRELNEGSAS